MLRHFLQHLGPHLLIVGGEQCFSAINQQIPYNIMLRHFSIKQTAGT